MFPSHNSALAPLDVWRNLSAQMPQVNFSQIMAEFKSLNISSQLQLLTQLTSGNISTTGLLAGLPISQLMNNTGGSLPLMLASMSNVTSGITSMINSFVSKLNVTGTGGSIGPWGSITNMLSGISNVFPSVTSNSIKSNSNTTQKSGGFKSASMWRLEAFVTVLSMVICRYAV